MNDTAECPHCHSSTVLEIEKPPIITIGVVLCSGAMISITEIKLYRQESLIALNNKRAKIASLSGGVSTGLGFFGSMGWVAGASMAVGAIESSLSNVAQCEAIALMHEVFHDEIEIRNAGKFLPVHKIELIYMPFPNAWKAVTDEVLGGTTPEGIKLPPKREPPMYVHDGAEFVTVKDADGQVRDIRWKSVESYALK